MFADFIPFWQGIAGKTWSEFVGTPELVKQCMRAVISRSSRWLLHSCMRAASQPSLDGGYTEGLELPLCMQETADRSQLKSMQIAMSEKVVVLRQLQACKHAKGLQTVKQTIQCVDALKKRFTNTKFCPVSRNCLRTEVAEPCRPNVRQIIDAACRCSTQRRDSLLQSMDFMYETSSVQVVKLMPAFLGLDLTEEVRNPLKQCFAAQGLNPIGVLLVADFPLLSELKGFKPKPQGFLGTKNLIFAQMDLPDVCESCW